MGPTYSCTRYSRLRESHCLAHIVCIDCICNFFPFFRFGQLLVLCFVVELTLLLFVFALLYMYLIYLSEMMTSEEEKMMPVLNTVVYTLQIDIGSSGQDDWQYWRIIQPRRSYNQPAKTRRFSNFCSRQDVARSHSIVHHCAEFDSGSSSSSSIHLSSGQLSQSWRLVRCSSMADRHRWSW